MTRGVCEACGRHGQLVRALVLRPVVRARFTCADLAGCVRRRGILR